MRQRLSGRRLEVVCGLLVVVVAAVYLTGFVRRGWIPHDEGTIAGDAVRVLSGEWPHVEFQDPYTGGMTWFYAWLFRTFGVDLQTIRWALFGGALIATGCWYWVALEFGSPLIAATLAVTGLVWSFPNYFAGLPSWWCLILASLALAAFRRYVATRAASALVTMGLCVGAACAVKQTGIYLVIAVALGVAFHEERTRRLEPAARRHLSSDLAARLALAGVAVALLGFVVALQPSPFALLVLLSPAALLTVFVAIDEWRWSREHATAGLGPLLNRLFLFGAGAAVPVAICLMPYVLHGHLESFVTDVFVTPQSRAHFAAYDPASTPLLVALAFYALIVVLLLTDRRKVTTPAGPVWVPWALLPIVVLFGWNNAIYKLVWNATRFGLLALAPLVVSTLTRRERTPSTSASLLFMCAIVAAYLAFFQFPFPAPIYFCYAAPIVLLAFVGVLHILEVRATRSVPLLLTLIAFAVLELNPGYADSIGLSPREASFETPLAVPRATLNVSAEDAEIYQTVVALVTRHSVGRFIHAFPDAPEIYYLTGRRNPTPTNFDFFYQLSDVDVERLWRDQAIDVLVINLHPGFSAPPSESRLALARRLYPRSATIDRFEVRWRDGS